MVAVLIAGGWRASAQSATFAGNAQHTAQFGAPAQRLNQIRWTTSIDLTNTGEAAHYGAPLITASNTVLVPVKTTNGFEVKAFEGATGRLRYTLETDYILPPAHWLPAYQPTLATTDSGLRFYYPGAGGTVYYIDHPDSDTPGLPVQQCFYTALTNYTMNASNFDAGVFINTPLTADTNGVIFFGFRIGDNGAPAPLNTNQGGIVRLDPQGQAIYVLAAAAANDSLMARVPHNCAPALSNDGGTLYAAVKWSTDAFYSYLLGLDSQTLATKYKVLLLDPDSGYTAGALDDGTSSPMVGPDGDVYFGVFGYPNYGGRGYLLHFGADLATEKPPGGFGWDYTAAVVPANMVSSYAGTSSYLLFSKYNNYNAGDGDGINKLALLDPNANQLDPHEGTSGMIEMREVLTATGCTPDDDGPDYPFGVKEWCINTAAVNPATKSVFAPSEDGHLYRWDLAANSLAEAVSLTPGFGEPYVPTVMGPDGTVYTLNGGTLFALGGLSNVAIVVQSSAPDLRSVVAGQPVTFTAVVTNLNPSDPVPTGTLTFQDLTYEGLNLVTNTLAADVPLTNSQATVTTSALSAGSNYLGNHFITAMYNGDTNFQSGSATMVQKVHASATTTTVKSTPGSNAVTFTAIVAGNPAGTVTPSGMVSFWDGTNFLAQLAVNTNGIAVVTNWPLSSGSHAITASYYSDTLFASSSADLKAVPPIKATITQVGDGAVQLSFTNASGAPFTVLAATNLWLPLSNWIALGAAVEIVPGQFQFTDGQAINQGQRFYCVRSP